MLQSFGIFDFVFVLFTYFPLSLPLSPSFEPIRVYILDSEQKVKRCVEIRLGDGESVGAVAYRGGLIGNIQ